MNMPNLRDWNPKASEAKHVDDTNMLDTVAREVNENNNAKNDNKELVNPKGSFGSLGALGRH